MLPNIKPYFRHANPYFSKLTLVHLHNNFQVLVQGVLMMVLEIGALYVTINFWLDGTISVGTVVLVQTFILSIFGKMWNLGKSIGRMIIHKNKKNIK